MFTLYHIYRVYPLPYFMSCHVLLITVIILLHLGCPSSTVVTPTMSDDEDHSAASVSAVAFKIPTFWPADPDLWFAQVEAQFSTRGITVEKTKYEYIVSALAPDTATIVRELILSPPTDAPYATLKAALIKRTAGSNQQKLQRLLTGVELGDQKPTQLLRRMRQLWNDDAGEALLQELFLQRLPANARMVLASSNPTSTLDELAETADRVMEVSVPAISAVANTPRASTAAEIESLRSEVRKLQELMTTMSVNTRSSRHRSPTPFRRRSPSPARHARSGGDHTLCWYHKRFGESATKCHAPCRYQGNEQARC